jgi:hypothetical protein
LEVLGSQTLPGGLRLMEQKDEIRPIYEELQGLLAQLPPPDRKSDTLDDPKNWEGLNNASDRLFELTKNDNYTRYKLSPGEDNDFGCDFVYLVELRTTAHRLINRLHGEYFSDEPLPFSGGPGSETNVAVSVNQVVTQQVLMDFKSELIKKLQEFPEDSPQRYFGEKLSGILSNVKNMSDIINAIAAALQYFRIV